MSESAGRLTLRLPGPASTRLTNDDSLARRAAQGDERAFAAIYSRHHQEIYRYCRAILRDPDDAQDALQATMVKALRALPGETREIALKPWLFRIAHNESISIIRARDAAAPLDATTEPTDPLAAPEVQAESNERLRQLVTDLDQLPERQRGALVMRELSGLSFEEIGRAFEFSPAAAKQAVYEARVALQEIAEGREMECDRVREAISARDRRVLRGRRIRAHLRGCERCSDFDAAIATRQKDFAALAPPLAVPAAAATLQAVLGGSVAGGSAAVGAGAIGGGLAGGAALKTAAAVLATAVIAGGAADLSGVIDVGGSSDRAGAPARESTTGSGAGGDARGDEASAGGQGAGERAHQSGHRESQGRGNGGAHGKDRARGNSAEHGSSAGHGQASAPGQTGSPGSSASAPGQTGTAGNSGSAPGHTGSAGSAESAPGQTGSTPGQSGSVGNSSTGQSHATDAGANASATGEANGTSVAPGQAATTPGQAGTAGDSATAPGQLDDVVTAD